MPTGFSYRYWSGGLGGNWTFLTQAFLTMPAIWRSGPAATGRRRCLARTGSGLGCGWKAIGSTTGGRNLLEFRPLSGPPFGRSTSNPAARLRFLPQRPFPVRNFLAGPAGAGAGFPGRSELAVGQLHLLTCVPKLAHPGTRRQAGVWGGGWQNPGAFRLHPGRLYGPLAGDGPPWRMKVVSSAPGGIVRRGCRGQGPKPRRSRRSAKNQKRSWT